MTWVWTLGQGTVSLDVEAEASETEVHTDVFNVSE
jgi:hypothetical protein